jgi:hypothetical protein
MLGRIRARGGDSFSQNMHRISGFVTKHLRSELKKAGRIYWCDFYRNELGEDKPEGKRILDEGRKLLANPEQAKGALLKDSSFKKYRRFGKYITVREKLAGNLSQDEVVLAVLALLTSLDVFECDEGRELKGGM